MESKQQKENARKAKEAAALFFPDEQWKKLENGIYLSPRRAIGEKTNFTNELRDAQILRDLGSTVNPRMAKGLGDQAMLNPDKGAEHREFSKRALNQDMQRLA